MTHYVAAASAGGDRRTGAIKLHGAEDFAAMRLAGQVTASVLDALADMVEPGVRIEALDDFAREAILAAGAIPANIGYRGYAYASCISINHVVCHGIPGARTLKDGDILNIDLTSIVDGWHGDSSRMYLAGRLAALGLAVGVGE